MGPCAFHCFVFLLGSRASQDPGPLPACTQPPLPSRPCALPRPASSTASAAAGPPIIPAEGAHRGRHCRGGGQLPAAPAPPGWCARGRRTRQPIPRPALPAKDLPSSQAGGLGRGSHSHKGSFPGRPGIPRHSPPGDVHKASLHLERVHLEYSGTWNVGVRGRWYPKPATLQPANS